MSIPNIYDLTHFNRKTHNIVVNLRYNQSAGHIEITQDGHTIIDTNFVQSDDIISYDFRDSKLLLNYCIKMYGLYRSISKINGKPIWRNIPYNVIRFNDTVDLYFYEITIPRRFLVDSRNDMQIYPNGFNYSDYIYSPFIVFSNDMIEPVPYFNITKMKYIKKHIINIPNTDFKLVYRIYKFHNIVFIYNSHIIKNDRMEIYAYWDEKYECFDLDSGIIPVGLKFDSTLINFKPIIGEFKHTFVYSYNDN